MFLALNAAVFDTGIATWEAKFHYDYVRPQSAIRDLHFGEQVEAWAGPNLGTQTIQGEDWQPYQNTTFVTPPFPEFTSGHSGFSFAAAKAIAAYVGSDVFYDGETLANYDLDNVEGVDLLGQFVGTELAFEEYDGPPITLQWDTLTEAAEEAGVSRIYGGIHIQDGDLRGRELGSDVAEIVQERWEALFTRGGDDDLVADSEGGLLIAGAGNDTVQGSDNGDIIEPGTGEDTVTTGDGDDVVRGKVADFFGDLITDFSADDTLVFKHATIDRGDIDVEQGSAIISIDEDGDGNADGSFTLEGDFSNGAFVASQQGGDTELTFEKFLPELAERSPLPIQVPRGLANKGFLAGDGEREFVVTIEEQSSAALNNALGAYELTDDGSIEHVRILFDQVQDQIGMSTTIDGPDSGNQLAFFIIQDGAGFASSLDPGDVLSFDHEDGDLKLALNGDDADQTVFHSHDPSFNVDDTDHVVSGFAAGGETIFIGFEDRLNGGDMDFQDVVFSVS